MRPIAQFQVFFEMLLQVGVSDGVAARLAAGHGLLWILSRAQPFEVARA